MASLLNIMNVNLDTLKDKLKPYLRKFLEDNGIEINQHNMFKCISKMHNDGNPSSKLLEDLNERQYYCYSCGHTGDIFTANEQLNDAPMIGHEFVHKNLYKLADKYKLDYEPVELTDQQIEMMEMYTFHRTVADLLTLKQEDGEMRVNSHTGLANKRGWTNETCDRLMIGTAHSHELFVKAIQSATKLTIDEIIARGIKKSIFNNDVITITIFDEHGRPVGFTGRWVDHEKGSKRPKYVNSPNSLIFSKHNNVFGLQLAKKNSGSRMDVFEGHADVVTAIQAGHKHCVAVGGSAISDEQVELMTKYGFTDINLVFDGDETGEKKSNAHVRELSGREGLNVFITRMPEGLDPDDLIKNQGLGEFYKLKLTSMFEFMMEHDYHDGVDKHKFVEKMIGIIINTANRIKRGEQIKSLADVTGVAEADIRDELDRLRCEDIHRIKSELQRNLHKADSADEILSLISTFETKIDSSMGSKDERRSLSLEECAESFVDLTTTLKNKRAGIQGWQTGFSILDHKLSGIPKPIGFDDEGNPIAIAGSIIGIAGAPQHCKSTAIQNIALRLASNNDDIAILYWSLDDSRERTYERMISMMSGVPWRAVTRRDKPTAEQMVKIEETTTRIHSFIQEGKLNVKDHSNGSTLPMLKRWIDQTKMSTDKPVLVILDSFHKIGSSSDEGSMTDFSITKKHSQEIKKLAQTHKVTVMCSLEMNKGQSIGSEPNLQHITETRKIEYDFDIIALVYNRYYDMDGKTDDYIEDPQTNRVMPMIKFNIKKSKDGGSGPVWFSLNTSTFAIDFYSTEEMVAMTNREPVTAIHVDDGLTINPKDIGTLRKKETPPEERSVATEKLAPGQNVIKFEL